MLNIDRVKRVLKAHKGFQAPQLTEGNRFMQYGPTGMMEDGNRDWFMINNEYLKGSTIPITNSEAEGTSVPNTVVDNPYQIPQFNWSPQLPQSPGHNQVFQQLLDQTLGKDLTKYKYSSLANSDQLLQDTLTKDKGNIFKSIGKFANNNQNLVQGGLNIIGDKLFGGTRNSKGYDMVQTGLSAFESVPGLGLYATLGKFALGAINKIGAKSIEDYHFNPYVYAKAGNSYSGTVNLGNRVRSLNDVEFGWFNRGEYNEAKDLRAEAVDQDYRLERVMSTNDDIRAKAGDNRMYTARNIRLAGGQDPRYVGIGKQGLKLQDKINIVKSRKFNQVINVDTKQVEEFKEGGKLTNTEWEPVIELFEEWEPEIILEVEEFQKGGKTRTLEELIEYAKKENPRFIQRLSENPRGIKFIDNEGNEAEGSHYLMSAGDLVVPQIQEVDGELKFFDEQNAVDRAIEKGNYLKMSPEEAVIFAEGYKQGWPKFFFKEVYDYYKDYDLSNAILIRDNQARTEGNKIYVNTDEDAVHELWHFLSQNKPNEKYKEFYDNLNDDRIAELGGDLNFVKRHEGDPGHFYHPSELEARIMAAKFKSQGQTYTKDFFKNLRSDENKYGYNMRDLLYMFNDENLEKIFNLKKGGTIKEELETPEIEETTQKNLIPEGALHKNKHHMEHTEGLTQKGIPVIDNEGEQQAEIELDEIIFTLEVTKKLEELYKDGSDEAAIEAGKLLVKEILFNTDDRTGLISKCEKGGKICQIEE